MKPTQEISANGIFHVKELTFVLPDAPTLMLTATSNGRTLQFRSPLKTKRGHRLSSAPTPYHNARLWRKGTRRLRRLIIDPLTVVVKMKGFALLQNGVSGLSAS